MLITNTNVISIERKQRTANLENKSASFLFGKSDLPSNTFPSPISAFKEHLVNANITLKQPKG